MQLPLFEVRLTRRTPENAGWGRSAGQGRSAGESVVVAVLLMGALFLAHGLQCASASEHGPVAMDHTIAVPGVPHDSIAGNVGDQSELVLLVSALNDPVATIGGSDVLGQAGVVCVAVLTAMGIWYLMARRVLLVGRGARLWPVHGLALRFRAAARWRPPPLDLAVLCVLRT